MKLVCLLVLCASVIKWIVFCQALLLGLRMKRMCFAINIIGEKRPKRLIQKEVADLVSVACVCVCV